MLRERIDLVPENLAVLVVRDGADAWRVRSPVQIDVGFGDAVQPHEASYPVLLEDFAAPDPHIYPREAVVAEKVQAMVDLGLANSRMTPRNTKRHRCATLTPW